MHSPLQASEPAPLSSVTVCILTHNRCEQLAATLDNLRKELGNDDIDIVVCNNGSTDATADYLTSVAEDWQQLVVINSKDNLGCAEGRNCTWNRVKTEFILSLDDDIMISRTAVVEMLGLLQPQKDCGLVSPIIVDSVSRRVLNPVADNSTHAKTFYEACLLLRSEMLCTVGNFDPVLVVAGEGLDFSIRLRRAGYYILRAPEVVVEHVDRIREGPQAADRRVKWLWSFAYVYRKHYPFPIAAALILKELFAHARSGRRIFGWRYCLSLLRPALSGARHGKGAKAADSSVRPPTVSQLQRLDQ